MSGWDAPQFSVLAAAAIGAAGATIAATITQRRVSKAQIHSSLNAKRADAYLDVLKVVYRIHTWTLSVMPTFTFEGDDKRAPDMLATRDEQLHSQAVIGLYGSEVAWDASDRFFQSVRLFVNDVSTIQDLDHDLKVMHDDQVMTLRRTTWRGIEQRRTDMWESLQALQRALAADLRAVGVDPPLSRVTRADPTE